MSGDYPVPFDQAGNLMSYLSTNYGGDHTYYDRATSQWEKVVLRENKPFGAKMTIVDYERGRSAARFTLHDEHGHEYPMFMSDMLKLVQESKIEFGVVEHRLYRVAKKGQNYGVTIA